MHDFASLQNDYLFMLFSHHFNYVSSNMLYVHTILSDTNVIKKYS